MEEEEESLQEELTQQRRRGRGRPRRARVAGDEQPQAPPLQQRPNLQSWSTQAARHACFEGFLVCPSSEQVLVASILKALANDVPGQFEESVSGKSIGHVFQHRLEALQPLRSSTWKGEAVAAGLDVGSDKVYKDRYFELAELIYISARLFVSSFLQKVANMIRLKRLIGVLLHVRWVITSDLKSGQ